MLITDKKAFSRLTALNKLELTEAESADTLALFAAQSAELEKMASLDTESVEPMVHVMPISASLREDTATAHFTRDELHAAAPDACGGYLRVPLLLE